MCTIDINTVSRSHTSHLVATGDDFGKVNIYRYPCISPTDAKCHVLKGHSSHVMNIQWTQCDQHLVSVGGNDKCIFQFKHSISDSGNSSKGNNSNNNKYSNDIDGNESSKLDSGGGGGAAGGGSEDNSESVAMEVPSGGDESAG